MTALTRTLTAVVAANLTLGGIALASVGPRDAAASRASAAAGRISTSTTVPSAHVSIASGQPAATAATLRQTPTSTSLSGQRSTAPAPAALPRLELKLIITPQCVEQGKRVDVRIVTRPGATVALASMDNGGGMIGEPFAGHADATGEVTLRWRVPLTATTGDALVNAIAADNSRDERAHAHATYQIRATGGC